MKNSLALLFCLATSVYSQSLGTAGTIRGKITDPSGASVVGATVSLANDLTLYRRDTSTSATGEFEFTNIPPNVYRLEVDAVGFQHQRRDLTVRSTVPMSLEIVLAIESQHELMTVTAETPLLETAPLARSDADSTLFLKMPTVSIATGLSDIITLVTPAVVADSDGFFRERYVNYRGLRPPLFLSEIGQPRSRRTEVRPIRSRRAISDLLTPARWRFRISAVCTAAVAGRPSRFPFSRA